jgi:hypothetical protein
MRARLIWSPPREATFTTLMEIQNYLRVSLSYGGGSCEKDSPFEIVAMEKEQKASLVHDFRRGKDNAMRTKRARRWRSVLFQRST